MKCDFCESLDLTMVYEVPTSLTNAKIYSCNSCGLLQSIYGDKSKKHTHKSISSGADWGNIRHGKKIRLNKSLQVLDKIFNTHDIKNILDIGSNRGHFVNFVLNNTTCSIDAIEPDNRILDEYKSSDRLVLYRDRFENIKFTNTYDLIYCCHTLEHASSSSYMLKTIRNLLNTDGYLYIDVPSISILNDDANVEEFFIDKHTYHFDIRVLETFIQSLGLHIVYKNDDNHNIIIVAKKINYSNFNKKLINKYISNLTKNHNNIQKVAKYIEKLCESDRVALYGASKIYDALVVYGKLDVSKITYIVDDYLFSYINDVHGQILSPSTNLTPDNIDTVILLTRSATEELNLKLKNLNIKNIISFNQLINNKI